MDTNLHDQDGWAKIFVQLAIGAAILAVGGLLAFVLYQQKTAPATTDNLDGAPPVEVVNAEGGNVPITIRGYGTVRARDRVQLVPQVDGRILSTNDNFAVGGEIRGGEVIATLDRADAELALQRSQAELDRLTAGLKRLDTRRKQTEAALAAAQTRLETQRAEAQVARAQFENLNPGREVPPLVAREPQVREAEASIAAAEADVEDIGREREELQAQIASAETNVRQAELNLQRADIVLPGDENAVYRVIEKNAEVGQYVSPGSVLGTLYKTSTLEVPVPLTSADLRWLEIGETPATLIADNLGMTWQGTVVRTEGEVDPQSRLVYVVIAVEPTQDNLLVPGLFVEAQIEGTTIENVAAVPRLALRQAERDNIGNNADRRTGGFDIAAPQRLYTLGDDGTLQFTDVEVIYRDRETAYVRGLQDGTPVVTTDLKVVTEGMAVDVAEAGQLPKPNDQIPSGESN